VYEAPLGEIEPGAYALRVNQTRPGSAALGRNVGLVAPTAAEYRLLGTNEPFLATLRAATGGRAIELPEEVWTHDLATTASFTALWPPLLVLALLLWPLDIALRRVSLGRREFADARRWVIERRWRRVAARSAPAEAMLAARERAAGATARAALLRAEQTPSVAPVGAAPAASPEATPAPAAARGAPASAPAPPATPPPDADTLARLRDAKRRARGG
jgi:hypothetical protein